MLTSLVLLSVFIPILISILFFFLAKSSLWCSKTSSIFECGFNSYFFSRFCFSSHYFIIGLIFLFLDLELCMLFPLFNLPCQLYDFIFYGWIFALILLMGLLVEWYQGALNWFYWAVKPTLQVEMNKARLVKRKFRTCQTILQIKLWVSALLLLKSENLSKLINSLLILKKKVS